MTRVCLDLFSGLGGFSSAFVDASEWEVVTVDINDEFDPDVCADVLDLRPDDLPQADVVLSSPPCKTFSFAASDRGHFRMGGTRATPRTDAARESVALVYHTLGVIHGLDPDHWFLENPRGWLRHVIGDPTTTVTYCQYGTTYQKPTDLWGDHPPMRYRRCQQGGSCHEYNGTGDGFPDTSPMPSDPAERAKVPYDLSESIREAVDAAFENPPPEQVELTSGGVWG